MSRTEKALTFLIVEDNPVNMELFSDLLRAAGHAVVGAPTAEEGIDLARERRPDVVLMDIQLPGMDGLAATVRLKADSETAGIPVVALTAHAMRGDAERAMAHGCAGYLTKPIETRHFVQTVLRAAAHPGAVREAGHPNEGAPATPVSKFPAFPVAPGPDDELLAPLPPLSPVVRADFAVAPSPVPAGGVLLGKGRGRGRRHLLVGKPPARRAKLLLVDDEPLNREVLEGMTHVLGYDTVAASDGVEALSLLGADIDLAIIDTAMPGMDGYELVRLLREDERYADLPVVMVTALAGRDDRLRAVEAGANDYLTRPLDRVEMRLRLEAQLRFKAVTDEVKRRRGELEAAMRSRTAELRRAEHELGEARQRAQRAQIDVVQRLAFAAETRHDPLGGFHLFCVGQYSAILGRACALSDASLDALTYASGLHDVGLLELPDDLVARCREGRRDPADEARFRDHAAAGARMLAGSPSEVLRAAEVIARSHHERWDGSGYPDGLSGEDIPLFGRIVAVADGYDALLRADPTLSLDASLARLAADAGTLYDPQLVRLFAERAAEVVPVYDRVRQRLASETPVGLP